MNDSNNSTQVTQLQNPSSNPSMGIKKKILVVDDEPDARELFAELLKTNPNYEVDVASDGNEALEKDEKLKFDLILLDIVMPNLDGVDTLATIKGDAAKYGNPIVIMLTNIGGDIAIQEAIKLGAIGYKLKIDTEPEELLQTVEDAFNGKKISNSTNEAEPPKPEGTMPPTPPTQEQPMPVTPPVTPIPTAPVPPPAAPVPPTPVEPAPENKPEDMPKAA